MSSKRASADAVIDLTLDSDDEQDMRSNRNQSNNSSGGSMPSSKRARTDNNMNNLEDDGDDEILIIDKDEFEKKPAALPSLNSPPKAFKVGVKVVDSSAARPTATAAPSINDDGDEELAVIGTRNEVKLPHSRQDCTKCKYTPNPSNQHDLRAQNEKHCELCYCYVCDALVKECKSWTSTDRAWQKCHCNATNQHDCWKKKRQEMKNGPSLGNSASGPRFTPVNAEQRTTPLVHRTAADFRLSVLGAGMMSDDEDERDDYVNWGGDDEANEIYYGNFVARRTDEPFAPDKLPSNLPSNEYGACPHCKWNNNIHGMQTNNDQRCYKCGRLAIGTKMPHLRQYTHNYSYKTTNQRLGVREVSFRIVARDVRQDHRFRSSWQQAKKDDPSWKYDEASMKQSVFDYKIGKRPKLKYLLDMISEWDEKTARQKNEDCIIMDPNDIALIRVASNFEISISTDFALYSGDVTSDWDAQNSIGTLKILLDCACGSFSDSHQMLLGCWCNVFPLNVSSISGTLHASDAASQRSTVRSSRDDMETLIRKHNEEADKLRSSLSLLSSTSNPDVGGFADADISLRGILEKYHRETFADRIPGRHKLDLDKISDHKNNSLESDLVYVLSYRDRAFAEKFLLRNWRMSHVNDCSTEGVLLNLENLGHTPELFCEGLEVEMLEFQKQSLKWAMERETTLGGVQSYFWSKVPITGSSLYFNPILGTFRTDKPKEVRGGIIAEEMGLGKTIISLALILKHPAPELPASGSNVSCLSKTPANSGSNTPNWNMELNDQISSDKNPHRGSILSRGTLVICPVSLVGQWIDEAKSKLSDPGLLYPYHGGNRIRDASILAKNAIVVTTYQVLASDDTYHRKKSSDPASFCPPLEQVRWWRVICDEGHQLRQANTNRNRSISRLVADHKWIVTGTPVSTSMFDLVNQLKLLGIESVEAMIARCCDRVGSRNANRYIKNPGKLRFLLRNLMIRHTQKQCYRGTSTTLMSLPPKKELSIEVSLSKDERQEYDAMEKAAKEFYLRFKAAHSDKLSSHYLLLSQKLTPQRVACSGGNPPLNPENGGHKEEDDDDDSEDVKLQRKSEIKYSDFCFTVKLKVLIAELKKARESDPTSKSLVFSQFNSTLKWLKEELPKHGFEFRTLSGNMSMKQRAKSLHDFQSDPPTTIFLLSMRAGNCGINLTQANRIFLMEPGFNPALEKQAIGRVHRLGQKRNVEIIRLFVKDSIETRIHKFLEKKYGSLSSADSEKEVEKNGDGGTKEVEAEVIGAPVGNLTTERPKNKMVTSEFDLLFGVESDNEAVDTAMPVAAAMPDAATSSGLL